MKTPFLAFGALLCLMLLAGFGQVGRSAESKPAGPSAREGAASPRFGPGYERLVGVLTEGQRSSLLEAIEGQRERAQELEQRLRTARRELLEHGLATKFDEALVRGKALAVARLEAELTVARFKAFSQMRPALSAEQINKLANTAGQSEAGGDEASPRGPEASQKEISEPAKKPGAGKTP